MSSASRLKAAARRALPSPVLAQARTLAFRSSKLADLWVRLDASMQVSHIGPDCQLVMDGFPRSGNTYARAAFLYANGQDTPISTHLHDPICIRMAIRRQLPAIVLIREPAAAVASYLQYRPEVPAITAIQNWRRYYEWAIDHLGDALVADFEDVVHNFGSIVERCNQRFGTEFIPYVRTEDAEQEVMAAVESSYLGHPDFEATVPRPSSHRRSAQDVVGGFNARQTTALAAANEFYLQFRTRAHSVEDAVA